MHMEMYTNGFSIFVTQTRLQASDTDMWLTQVCSILFKFSIYLDGHMYLCLDKYQTWVSDAGTFRKLKPKQHSFQYEFT